MCCQLNYAKLAFPKRGFYIIIVKNICVPDCLFDSQNPLLLLLLRLEIKHSRLVGRKHYFDRPKSNVDIEHSIFNSLFFAVFQVSADKGVHHPVLIIILLPKTKQIVANYHTPMFLQPVTLSFEKAFTFVENVSSACIVTEVIHYYYLVSPAMTLAVLSFLLRNSAWSK